MADDRTDLAGHSSLVHRLVHEIPLHGGTVNDHQCQVMPMAFEIAAQPVALRP